MVLQAPPPPYIAPNSNRLAIEFIMDIMSQNSVDIFPDDALGPQQNAGFSLNAGDSIRLDQSPGTGFTIGFGLSAASEALTIIEELW